MRTFYYDWQSSVLFGIDTGFFHYFQNQTKVLAYICGNCIILIVYSYTIVLNESCKTVEMLWLTLKQTNKDLDTIHSTQQVFAKKTLHFKDKFVSNVFKYLLEFKNIIILR
jgi:hypothetical protein